ncbi:16S rRNA (uracil(1498)-N(3))-methyltransferase [Lachnoanaerobaculum umeaense]|jgi:RNA methyltransferase, rsmE family|uniref:Ribosomal RNA small subunit methyltransferase E n=1 Tax=Lachnoanaerobaculum umeaense TaxID=617123 RepID=A0A385PYB9_9FIRM|nr:16S rRNA (uracil(1498)-N(3))-methyltransferase [Lachnoanaerobaculum umeaense]AYA98925.1 16S rRNA (uracil(1498)-N(3))-methyltransferase [Lachnoanaerobaculum umeaense]PZW94988.1 16S rRNA (uracil1498-N3)-methyltransferase [Lachnoanaerobaculum umeaense]
MYHFFVGEEQISGENAYIEGSDVKHIVNVLRMKTGEKLLISVKGDWDYLCKIVDIETDRVNLKVLESMEQRELPVNITLLQGIPKSDKLEMIIQKAVELGVSEIIPVKTKRVVVKIEEKKLSAKLNRWNAIAESAAKQSKRSIIPKILEPQSIDNALEIVKDFDVKLIPYENADSIEKTRRILDNMDKTGNISVFIGPEGGFEEDEVKKAIDLGFEVITLGKRILRTETAGLALLSNIMIRLEEE